MKIRFVAISAEEQPPTTILQNANQLVNFADWLISDRERHFCPSWSEVKWGIRHFWMSDRLRPGNVSQVGTYFNCHIYDKAPLCIIANQSPGKNKELRANLARSSGKHDDPVNFAPSWREVDNRISKICMLVIKLSLSTEKKPFRFDKVKARQPVTPADANEK